MSREITVSFAKAPKTTKTSIRHNERREEDVKYLKNKDDHIHSELTKYNLHLVDVPMGGIEKYFNELYKPYVDDFNSHADERAKKQKKKPQIIKNAYAHFTSKANTHPVNEFVVGVGHKGDFDLSDPKQRKFLGNAYKDYLSGFKERNPELVIASAQVHFDEAGASHMHLVTIPMAHGYKNGLSVHPTLNRALGFSKTDDSQRKKGFADWTEQERNEIVKSLGKDYSRKKTDSKNRDAVDVNLYREAARKATQLNEKSKQSILKFKWAEDNLKKVEEQTRKLKEEAATLTDEELQRRRDEILGDSFAEGLDDLQQGLEK